mgnify:CR=1 FL=1
MQSAKAGAGVEGDVSDLERAQRIGGNVAAKTGVASKRSDRAFACCSRHYSLALRTWTRIDHACSPALIHSSLPVSVWPTIVVREADRPPANGIVQTPSCHGHPRCALRLGSGGVLAASCHLLCLAIATYGPAEWDRTELVEHAIQWPSVCRIAQLQQGSIVN